MSPRAQELAQRVWHLPHVRFFVIGELCTILDLDRLIAQTERRRFLLQFMTLDRNTSIDAAMHMYPALDLGTFPWDCADEHRKRAYAAGVLSLSLDGGLPLLRDWKLEDVIDYFPNTRVVGYHGVRLVLKRKAGYTCANGSALSGVVELAGGLMDHSLVNTLRAQHSDTSMYQLVQKIHVFDCFLSFTGDGKVQVPGMFFLPLEELSIQVEPGRHFLGWLALLAYRKVAGIVTKTLAWKLVDGCWVGAAQGAMQLATIAPPGLKTLKLQVFAIHSPQFYAGSPIPSTLSALAGLFDVRHLPGLKDAALEITIPQDTVLEDPAHEEPLLRSDIVFSSALHVHINLAICEDDEEPELSTDPLDVLFLKALPLRWLEELKQKLDEVNGRLSISTLHARLGISPPSKFGPPAVVAVLEPYGFKPFEVPSL